MFRLVTEGEDSGTNEWERDWKEGKGQKEQQRRKEKGIKQVKGDRLYKERPSSAQAGHEDPGTTPIERVKSRAGGSRLAGERRGDEESHVAFSLAARCMPTLGRTLPALSQVHGQGQGPTSSSLRSKISRLLPWFQRDPPLLRAGMP